MRISSGFALERGCSDGGVAAAATDGRQDAAQWDGGGFTGPYVSLVLTPNFL
jgi:hypothetical protein